MKGLSSNGVFMFYNLPEEALATMIMVAQLKRLKISNNHPDERLRGMSMYDLYHVVESEVNGVTVRELKFGYKNPQTGEIEKVTRGVRNISADPNNPEYTEISALEPEEVVRLHYVYERIHGGYRVDERIRFEYGVFNQLFLMFRRFLPNILRNVGMSAGKREALGYFKTIGKDASGNEIVEWQSRIIEGR